VADVVHMWCKPLLVGLFTDLASNVVRDTGIEAVGAHNQLTAYMSHYRS
jgi:sRNA-binding protein